MSGHVSENRLALYASGDLPVSEAARVAGHLRDCMQCRGALGAFEEARSFLIASAGDPDPRDLHEIRQRVASRLRIARPEKGWAFGFAGIAAAIILLVFGIGHQRKTTNEVNVVAQLPPPPVPAPVIRIVPATHRAVRKPRAGLRSVALITRTDKPPLIRMTTADPSVVILWESNGEGEKE